MKNYKLDTKLLPEVWVTWYGKCGRIWMDSNGTKYNKPRVWMRYDNEGDINYAYRKEDDRIPYGKNYYSRKSDKIWVPSGTQLCYAYAKYHKDIDRLELAIVKYDTTRKEGKHGWTFAGDRLFVGRDKSILDENGNVHIGWYTVKYRASFRDARDAIRAIVRVDSNGQLLSEFKKFLGHNYFIIGNGASEYVEHAWQINKWYDSVQKKRTKGKSQQLVDKLVKFPLEDIEHLGHKYPRKTRSDAYRWESQTTDNIIYFEHINDEWSVLRALIRNDSDGFDESWRVYLGSDGTSRIASKSDGGWIPSSQSMGWGFEHKYYFANEELALEKCNRIKYIAPIIRESESIKALITTLRFPCIEQLYKIGQTKMALKIARESNTKAVMKEIFGYYNEKESSILRQLGMTKYQLDVYGAKYDNNTGSWSHYSHCYDIIKKMRETFGDDLSSVDNDTFSKYFKAFDDLLSDMRAIRYLDALDIDKSKFWKNAVRLNAKNPNAARLISDTLSIHNNIYEDPIEVDWFFDDYSDIVRIHDALIQIQTQRDAERRAYYNMAEAERRRKDDEKRKKVDEGRKHYEYEDDNFIIRLPKDVYEILREGTTQSICIGNYTNSHSTGRTNLFFLRRKDAESLPFYAIEMDNNKRIVQIHGSCNKWLGNNPEAIPTVVRWLRKHGITCDDKILTCTARGYGRTNEYIAMPIVD